MELSYPQHSGFGVQVQQLMAAAWLANATSRRLVVPPWLVRDHMEIEVWNNKLSRGCRPVHLSQALMASRETSCDSSKGVRRQLKKHAMSASHRRSSIALTAFST